MSVVSREGYKFSQDICVPCFYTDASFYLKPASFMDMAQEIAYWAAQELGFGYDDLHIHHIAWVLSRMHFHFADPPKWRDDVTLYTWHKGADGLFYLRDFYLQDPLGNRLVTATSSWVVIDERTRRLVRPEDLQDLMGLDDKVDDAIEERAPKVAMPRGMEPESTSSAIPTMPVTWCGRWTALIMKPPRPVGCGTSISISTRRPPPVPLSSCSA